MKLKRIVVLLAVMAGLSGTVAETCPVIPFVAVTGRPAEADVVRKVARLKEMGYDQFLIYARSGLQYAYMGEEWLRLNEWFCREAEARGMKVWLYDEYNWPSGTCRGRVPRENDAWRYAENAVYRETDGSYRWTELLAPQGWVNVYEPEAVARFIELTHKVYEKRLARWFENRTIRGIFTDEPGHPTGISFKGRPVARFRRWSRLEADYRAATGRAFRADVEAWLTARAADPKGAASAPSAAVWEVYAELMGRQFRTSYFDQIRAWCDRMGIVLTGHLISENSVTGSCRSNGNPLHVLKGESLPGMDEIGSRARTGSAEWLTLALAQHAARRGGRGGLVELFALGPGDMTPARMRQMFWLVALHNIDHYVTCMEVMDMRGLVEKHGYLSPIQEGQSWSGQMRPLLAESTRAARFARKTAFARVAAVRYPQKAAARATYAGGRTPPLLALLRAFNTRQVAFELYEEDEPADEPFVFTVRAGGDFREERSGTVFATADAAVDWVHARTRPRLRVFERSGAVAGDVVVRNYDDGSSVALNLQEATDRVLVAEREGTRTEFRLPARGVLVLEAGEAVPPVRAESVRRLEASSFALSLAQGNVWRVNFDTNKVGTLTVAAPLRGIRFALRDCALAYAVTASGRPVDGFEQAPKGERVFRHAAEPYTFELDGKPLAPARACTVLRPDFNALYRETEPLDLAPGVHTLRIVTGEADQNFFLPAVFATGDFAVFNGLLVPRPRTAGVGTLDGMGLGTYPGALSYTATVTPPAAPCRLRLETGGVFTSVSWNGRPLGVRAWDPFEWDFPAATDGKPGTLAITLYLPLVNMMGDLDAPNAKWDLKMWTPPRTPDSAAGLLAPPIWVW